MKKKLKKQKFRLFLGITLSMFLLSIIVFITIAINILNTEKEKLESDTYAEFTNIADNVTLWSENLYYDTDSFINDRQISGGSDRAHIRVSDVTDTNDSTENIIAETKNAISVDFYDKEKVSYYGLINFDDLRDNLTKEQYETICDYLSRNTTANGEQYILVCTEFFYNGGTILPNVIEILLTKPENDWYIQDTVIERYVLNPDVLSSYTLCKAPEDLRNVIFKEFVLGEYEVVRYLDDVDKFWATFDSYEYYTTHREGPFPLKTGLFTYLVYYNDYKSGYKYYVSDPYDTEIIGTSEPYAYDISYAKEINVLNGSIDTIIVMFIYIFILFSIVGVIIGAISWHTLKKQIEQEQRLRTVTNAMAHELKTPLFIIGGYCDNLMENINTEKHEHYAYVISQQTQEMNELVVRMLDYSKLDSASFSPKIELFSINILIKEIIANYEFYNIEFNFDKQTNIKADKKLITSVIENLIDNAIKYTTDIDKIKVSVKNGKFSVSNPCIELTKKDIDEMWQPYHRKADTSDKEGYGLGLAIVKSILDLHNVKYRAEYADGIITFEFNLPK